MPGCLKSRPGNTGDGVTDRDGYTGISPADGIILSILRMDQDKQSSVFSAKLPNADWEGFLRKAARHGVSPMLYHRIIKKPPGIPIPEEVIRKLHEGYLVTSVRNMRLYHELGKALAFFRREDIQVIALKGTHLAEKVYGNISLRPMSDVDLLVRQDDILRVEKILLEMGYVPTECNRLVTKDNYNFGYWSPGKKLYMEIHWKFLPCMDRFHVDMDGLWKRSGSVVIAGVEVSVLSPEDLIVHLCLHASKHLFDDGLKPFVDITETILKHGEGIDWNRMRMNIAQSGTGNCMYLTLSLAREFLGAHVPEEFMKTIRPADFEDVFFSLAKSRVFAAGGEDNRGVTLSPNIAQLFGPRRIIDKASLLVRRVIPPKEEMALAYPPRSDSFRIYFYYPVRIWDLIFRHGRKVWRLLRKDEIMNNLADREMEISPLRDWLMASGNVPE